MNKELKRKWVEALRSGKYKQEFIQDRTFDNKFDVVAVLMDIYDPTAWEKWFCSYRYNKVDEVHALIPKKLLNTLTIKSWGNRIKFDKLADWIEKKIPEDE
jgi:hypothetical protein